MSAETGQHLSHITCISVDACSSQHAGVHVRVRRNFSHQVKWKPNTSRFGRRECYTYLISFLPFPQACSSEIQYNATMLLATHPRPPGISSHSTNSAGQNIATFWKALVMFIAKHCACLEIIALVLSHWECHEWRIWGDGDKSGRRGVASQRFLEGNLFKIRVRSGPLYCAVTERLPLRYAVIRFIYV